MAASYDGVLSINPKDKSLPIRACCRTMDEAVMRRQMYISTKGGLMLRRTDDPKKGDQIINCPFCGARVQSITVQRIPEIGSPAWESWEEQALRGEGPLAVPKQEGEP